jgi:cytoskeleton-associated protein 5
MLSGVAAGLETTNPMQRKELATWLEARLEKASASVDLTLIAGPSVACLEDRSAEVRKAAQSLLPYIITSCGYQALLEKANALKPASRSAVLPLLESAKSAASGTAPQTKESLGPLDSLKPSRPGSVASASSSDIPPTKHSGRAPTAINRPLKAPASLLQSSSRSATPTDSSTSQSGLHKVPPQRNTLLAKASPTPTVNGEPPLRSSNVSAKQNRGSRETGPLKWTIETSARPDQVDYLHHQMAPHASTDLVSLLFSKDQHCERDYLSGLSILANATSQETAELFGLDIDELRLRMVANADLVLKYLTIRLADSATVITLKCFDVFETVITTMLDLGNQLSDYEAGVILPSLILKVSIQMHSAFLP